MNEPRNQPGAAQRRPQQSAGPAIALADIYYILFRHKWKIVVLSLLGLIGAGVVKKTSAPMYQSEARLFVKYVMEIRNVTATGQSENRVALPDARGSVINTELQILTSLDLAKIVAQALGPEKILAKAGGGKDLTQAAVLIRKNVVVEAPKYSSVIRVTFTHPDVEVAQPVLKTLVDTYLKKHAEVHQVAAGSDDFFTRETDQYKTRLAQTEELLRNAKLKAGPGMGSTLEETKKSFADQINRVRQSIFDTEALLAEHRTIVADLTLQVGSTNLALTNAVVAPATNALALGTTNGTPVAELPAGDPATTQPALSLDSVPTDKIDDYRRILTRIDTLAKNEDSLLIIYTTEAPQVKNLREQIAQARQQKAALETEFPALALRKTAEVPKVAVNSPGPARNPFEPAVISPERLAAVTLEQRLQEEKTRANALEARIKQLNSQLEEIRKDEASFAAQETVINELQRRKKLEEENYVKFANAKEQARIDEANGPERISNISVVDQPTPPFPVASGVYKTMAMLAFGGIALGLGLAFFIELVLDSSLKRPVDIENKIGLPLFLTIPRETGQKTTKKGALKKARKASLLTAGNGEAAPDGAPLEVSRPFGQDDIAPWDPRHPLRLFYEVLRDRLLVFFEVRKVVHKPKLVAVTSCGAGAGVTTTAAGLAASLSETGDGNVLLVDMNDENGAAHYFYKGKLGCGIDDALEMSKRDSALVQENLYVVTESSTEKKMPRVMPRRFTDLVPKLEASDYDYIIFDMPPVTQTSVTPRLARFMDIVLLVVESEKTNRDVVKRAANLLAQSTPNVNVILNKNRSYLPQRLQQDVL